MVINQGDVCWVDLGEPIGSGPSDNHPHVVIQNNMFNHSRLRTVLVCALTSNLKRAEAPGNILLEEGEANLPKRSVVIVSQITTVEKSQLGEYVGSLAPKRMRQILDGLKLLTEPRDSPRL
jgi:mRNA interferase MazF